MTVKKHALLIAVRDNPKIRRRHRSYRILMGCEHDVDLMRGLLFERFGFDDAGTRVLKTRQATRDAIRAAVDGLVGRAGRGDVVVVYYSGHGSWMRDPDDPEKRLETIVPYDSSRGPEENRDIQDVEIDRWVRRLNEKTPYVTLIFDCCHSGSVTRDPFGHVVREVAGDPRPADETFAEGRIPALSAGHRGPRTSARIRSGWLPVGRLAVTVAACREDQTSWEMKLNDGGSYYHHGVLTYHLAGALVELAANGPTTWRDVLERVAPRVIAGWPAQHPQVEGEIDQVVFGKAQARAEPYLPVVAAEGDGVDLWGGAAHGVRPGSSWGIRPHGCRSCREEGSDLARVRLERVRAATSWGRVVESAKDGLQAGQRAFLLEYDAEAPGLTVAIEAPLGPHRFLAETLGGSELLTLAEDAESADVLVRWLEPRPGAGPGDPCPRLGAIDVPTWAAVGRDGRLEARPRPAGDAAARELVSDLVQLARFRGLLSLENPDPESRLRRRVDLRVLDASGDAARRDPERGIVVVREGDFVDFEIENRHDEEVWVSLLELDCDRSVTVLMPGRGHAAFKPGGRGLGPGQVLRVGRDYYRTEGGLEQSLPSGFPWAAADGDLEVGVAFLKLLVTSVPADFEFLEMPAMRKPAAHPLEVLVRLYQSGSGRRSVVLPAVEMVRDEDWTAATEGLGTRRKVR